MRRFLTLLAVSLLAVLSHSAQAQDFHPGWYIVEPSAEFLVMQRGMTDPENQTLWIAANEAILCHDKAGDTSYCFEQNGRLSAVRGTNALTPAEPNGRPGYVTQEIQLMDRVLSQGMSLWVTSLNAGTGIATVQLGGGRHEQVPAGSVAILSNYFRNALAGQSFTPVMN